MSKVSHLMSQTKLCHLKMKANQNQATDEGDTDKTLATLNVAKPNLIS
jgi:hypothetical protein